MSDPACGVEPERVTSRAHTPSNGIDMALRSAGSNAD
jgi:hypothetical protein